MLSAAYCRMRVLCSGDVFLVPSLVKLTVHLVLFHRMCLCDVFER
jgi:hypothetical protein